MKPLLIACLLFITTTACWATTPFGLGVYRGGIGDNIAIAFPWPDQDEHMLFVRFGSKTQLYTFKELGFENNYGAGNFTTAGNDWYQQALATYVWLERPDGAFLDLFVLRLKSGEEIRIDISTMQINPKTTADEDKKIRAEQREMALAYTHSEDSRFRHTSARHLKDLGETEDIKELSKLLADEATYHTSSGAGPLKEVYYIREAAESAIAAIKERGKQAR